MALLLASFLALHLVHPATSQPTVSFPINSQLPPVARIDQLFSYSFSPYTFRSDTGTNLTYTLGDHPDWLSIEGTERRLFGTPEESNVPPGDVVGQSVEIIATDDTGSVSLNATLVVSRNEAPDVKIPISEQIQKFGHYSAPSSLLSYPSTDITYSFDPNTFEHQAGDTNYYAVSDDSSPLPAWLRFDAATLTFSGKTPAFESLVQPPQTFNFELVASDVVGFSASSISFSIVVGSHKLTTDKPIITFNTSRGSSLSYEGLEDGIKLDDKQVKPGDLDVSTDDLPGWLSFDTKTWKLDGTPGKGDHSTNFTINFHDDFADTLSVVGVINVATSLFETTLSDMEVMPGDKFELDMTSYFRDPNDIQVTIDAHPKAEWLKLDGLKMSGRVPESASGDLKISIAAASKSTGTKETESFGLSFIEPNAETTTSTTTSTSATATSAEPSNTHTHTGTASEDAVKQGSGNLSTSQILLATIIPIIAIALIIMLLVCFFRRRRTKRTYLSSKYRSKISKPVVGTLRVNGSDPSIRQVGNEKSGMIYQTHILHAEKNGGYASVGSRPSSGSRSDVESLELLSTPDLPPGFMGGGLGSSVTLSNSASSGSGRQSWFTVDGGSGRQPSDRTQSHRSDTTFSEPTHMLLTTPSLAFRDGLDMTIPSLDEMSSMQPTPDVAYMPPREAMAHRSVDVYSTTTSSSEALPARRHSKQRSMGGPSSGRRRAASAATTMVSPLTEQDESESHVPELPRPTQARLSSQQWMSGRRPGTSPGWSPGPGTATGSHAWQSASISSSSKSLHTDTSFGSGENWRVIGRPGKSYRDLVEEAPFHPGSGRIGSGSGSGSGGGSGSGNGTGSADDRGGSEGSEAWKTENSGLSKASSGSFKAFL